MNVSNFSDNDVGHTKDDPTMVGIPQSSMSPKRINELMSRYGMPLGYTYRLPPLKEDLFQLHLMMLLISFSNAN